MTILATFQLTSMEEQGVLVNLAANTLTTSHTLSWLYNLFDDQIADVIKSTLSDSLCSTAVNYTDTKGNDAVESIPRKSLLLVCI